MHGLSKFTQKSNTSMPTSSEPPADSSNARFLGEEEPRLRLREAARSADATPNERPEEAPPCWEPAPPGAGVEDRLELPLSSMLSFSRNSSRSRSIPAGVLAAMPAPTRRKRKTNIHTVLSQSAGRRLPPGLVLVRTQRPARDDAGAGVLHRQAEDELVLAWAHASRGAGGSPRTATLAATRTP